MDIERLFNEEVMSLDTYIMFKLKATDCKIKRRINCKKQSANFIIYGRTNCKPAKSPN